MFSDRFDAAEMWDRIGIDPKDAHREIHGSEGQMRFRKRLFSRIVPTVRDIGLWSDKVQAAFTDLGAIEYGKRDAVQMLEEDAAVAAEFDRLMAEGWKGGFGGRKAAGPGA